MADKEKKRNAVNYRLKGIARLGGACFNDGETDVRVLDIHHKNGGGNKHRALYGNDWDLYYLEISILPDKELHRDYQVLCANCHRVKHAEDVVTGLAMAEDDDLPSLFD